jgi:SAM-dependent methyltransferase
MLDGVPDVRYTHGHHESVLRSHRWRTAENSAAYLVPHLRPGQTLLDVGCGPGTITADLAERVSPGPVIGVDASIGVLEGAVVSVADNRAPVGFTAADVFSLPFPDETFDVVHAHQVLQHLGDPVAALVEMGRVCRPEGFVAARDSDYPRMTWFPTDDTIAHAFEAYGTLTRVNGANWDAGRRLLSWAQAAGFTDIVSSASAWCFATVDERTWWGELWAERFTHSDLADQLTGNGIASRGELAAFAAAFRRWAAAPDGWFAVLHGEVVATP